MSRQLICMSVDEAKELPVKILEQDLATLVHFHVVAETSHKITGVLTMEWL